MGVDVELDIFSGMPNPRWSLSPRHVSELIEQVRDGILPVRRPDDAEPLLGYRGFIITATGQHGAGLMKDGLPSRFRLAGTAQMRDSLASEHFLLNTGVHYGQVLDRVADVAPVAAGTGLSETQVIEQGCACDVGPADTTGAEVTSDGTCWFNFTSSTDYTFWNGASYISYNNCYNYASNWRTNSFAQPGRGSGQMFTQLTVADIKAAAARDGYRYTCPAGGMVACLVIWPGVDYHWYRRTADLNGLTCWSHKPGKTAARHTDNSGRQITSPYSCNRGSYTTYGGFMYFNGTACTTVR